MKALRHRLGRWLLRDVPKPEPDLRIVAIEAVKDMAEVKERLKRVECNLDGGQLIASIQRHKRRKGIA